MSAKVVPLWINCKEPGCPRQATHEVFRDGRGLGMFCKKDADNIALIINDDEAAARRLGVRA